LGQEFVGCGQLADFNDPDKLGRSKEMVERLSSRVAIFENPGLDFSKNRAEGDDLLGDAYEYLMRHFATESGKRKEIVIRRGTAAQPAPRLQVQGQSLH
jgi:type I restriction enzyme M protein